MRLYAFICGYICVYMLDGERSCVRSESVQKTHAIVYDRQRHVVVALSSDIDMLSASKKKGKRKTLQKAFQIIFNNY